MDGHNLTNEQILAFSTALFQAERSQATVEKYLRSVRAFFLYLNGQPVTKDTVLTRYSVTSRMISDSHEQNSKRVVIAMVSGHG